MRNEENAIAACKAAIHIYAKESTGQKGWQQVEEDELKMLQRLLGENTINSQTPVEPPNSSGSEAAEQERLKEQQFKPTGLKPDASKFEKIIAKILHYNERINQGKEIQVIGYLQRIDMESPFMKKYESQRLLRRSYFEEYKIHCFNFILLLFESCVRILTTMQIQNNVGSEDGGSANVQDQYYSKNYRRFLEHRHKKLDKFSVNCIGWNHV